MLFALPGRFGKGRQSDEEGSTRHFRERDDKAMINIEDGKGIVRG